MSDWAFQESAATPEMGHGEGWRWGLIQGEGDCKGPEGHRGGFGSHWRDLTGVMGQVPVS